MDEVTQQLSADSMQGYVDKAVELAMVWGPQLLLAIVVLIVRFETVITLALRRRNVTPDTTPVGHEHISTME